MPIDFTHKPCYSVRVSNKGNTLKLRNLALTAIVAGTQLITGAQPVSANTGTFAEHKQLWEAISEVGISRSINHPQVCNGDRAGVYVSAIKAIVICQDNMVKPLQEVTWTNNDLDTLRHEAQHMIQDCVAGGIGNNRLENVFEGEDLRAFLNNTLDERQIEFIIDAYSDKDDDTILLELEAFAVADTISPTRLADTLLKYCMS